MATGSDDDFSIDWAIIIINFFQLEEAGGPYTVNCEILLIFMVAPQIQVQIVN